MPEIWFWQRIVSPLMAGLVAALAGRGARVVYVAELPLTEDRRALGWDVPSLGAARLLYAQDAAEVRRLVAGADAGSIHICEGLRANGLVGVAQQALAARGLEQWVVMETVDEPSLPLAWAKRAAYRCLIRRRRPHLQGILATGHATAAWVAQRGMAEDRVFPFTYFLQEPAAVPARTDPGPFRILFVGQLIARKRVDLLLDAVARLGDLPLQLAICGAGVLEAELRRRGEALPADRLLWLGVRPRDRIPVEMAAADCLVLPSRHDGWGAVVSEAMMAGTPAICSDRCGAAGIVRASGLGGVFPAGDAAALADLLRRMITAGRLPAERRRQLAAWSRCLGAEAGADYLLAILAGGTAPPPPWTVAGTAPSA